MERLEERTVLSSFLAGFGGVGAEDSAPAHGTDSAGNSYLSGQFNSQPADFDPGPGVYNLSSAGGNDAFIAKYGSDGSLAWARSVGGAGDDQAFRSIFSHEGAGDYVYVAGYFSSASINFGPGLTLTNAGQNDTFLAKFDAQTGATVWVRGLGSAGYEGVQDLALANGNVYLSGSFENTIDFDPGAGVAALTADPNASTNGFVWTLDANGNYVSAWQLGTSLESIVVEGDSLYVKGRFWKTVDFDPGPGDASRTPVGTNNLYVAHYSTAGALRWLQTAQLVIVNSGTIASDASSIYVPLTVSTGTSSYILVTSYNKADGSIQWSKQFGGGGYDWCTTAVVNPTTGMLYAGGYINSASVDFNPGGAGGLVTNSGAAGTDAFVLKMNAATGTFSQVSMLTGPGNSHARIQDAYGSTVYVSAYFDGMVTFPTGGTLTSQGTRDSYLMALDESETQRLNVANVSQAEGNAGTTNFAFAVKRTGDTSGTTTVNWNTVDGTATAASGDYVAASGQLTFGPNETTKTIVIAVNGNAVSEGNETFGVQLSSATSGTIVSGSAGIGTILDDDGTKFYVVNDGSPDRTYEYGSSGASIENYTINIGNTAPRGAASTAAGDKVWVVDANKNVYVYNTSGGLLGSWAAGSLPANADVQGITTDGNTIWIVDKKGDRVYRYYAAATRLSGSQTAIDSFSLNGSNTSPKDLVTDGTSIWIVNNSSTDKVFKYSMSGTLVGSWTINGGGGSPTGITIDPTNVSDIWIVDSSSDRVYGFAGAASRTSGSQSPASSFALAAGNTNPQGIADPPPALSGAARVSSSRSLQVGNDANQDIALLSLIGELNVVLGKKRR